jgi:hypothetical protein
VGWCAGADSCAGVGSGAGVDSGAAGDSWEGGADADSLVVAACGACDGGCSDREDVVGVFGWARDLLALLVETALVLPAKACAAASAKTPVNTMLPEINQRLIR